MLVTGFNPGTDNLEKTYINKAISKGATTIEVSNPDRFSNNVQILIGEMGGDGSEIVNLSSVSDNTFTVGTTEFSHSADTPIYLLRYDQIKFYYSTDGIDGTYSLLTTEPMDVDNREKVTRYDHTSGLSTYYYKVSLYNSISTVESSLSDPVKGTGYTRKTASSVIQSFNEDVGNNSFSKVSRQWCFDRLNDCSDNLVEEVAEPYAFLEKRTAAARTANQEYLDDITDSDGNSIIWKLNRIEYNYTDDDTSPVTDETYILRELTIEEFNARFSDNTIDSTTTSDKTKYYAWDESVDRYRFSPPFATSGNAAIYVYYYKHFTLIDTDSDEVETPTTSPYDNYLRYRFYLKLMNSDRSYERQKDEFLRDYSISKRKLPIHNRKNVGQPRGFEYLPQSFKGWSKY